MLTEHTIRKDFWFCCAEILLCKFENKWIIFDKISIEAKTCLFYIWVEYLN